MDKYTKFILTVIAVAMIGILFKGEKIITSAHAIAKHQHIYQDVQANTGESFIDVVSAIVKEVVKTRCWARQLGGVNIKIFCQ